MPSSSNVIEALIQVKNEASGELQKLQGDVNSTTAAVQKSGEQTTQTGSKFTNFGNTLKSNAGSITAVTGAAWGLFNAFDDLEKKTLAVDRLQTRAETATKAHAQAKIMLTNVEKRLGKGSAEYAVALKNVQLTQDKATQASQKASIAAGDLQEHYIQLAMQVGPQFAVLGGSIAQMVGNFSKAPAAAMAAATATAAMGPAGTTGATGINAASTASKGLLATLGPLLLIIGAAVAIFLAVKYNAFGFRDALNAAGEAIGNAIPFLKPVLQLIQALGVAIGMVPAEELGKEFKSWQDQAGKAFKAIEGGIMGLPKVVADVAGQIGAAVSQTANQISTFVSAFMKDIIAGNIPAALNKLKDLIMGIFTEWIQPTFDDIYSFIIAGLEKIVTAIGIPIELVKKAIGGLADFVFETIDRLASGVSEAIQAFASGDIVGAVGALNSIFEDLSTTVLDIFTTLGEEILTLITDLFTVQIPAIITDFATFIAGEAAKWPDLIIEALSGLADAFATEAPKWWEALQTAFAETMDIIVTNIPKHIANFIAAFQNINWGEVWAALTGAFSGAIDWIQSNWRNILQWLWDNVISHAPGMFMIIASTFNDTTNLIKKNWGQAVGNLVGALIGGFLGARFGPMGFVVGASIGSLIGGAVGATIQKWAENWNWDAAFQSFKDAATATGVWFAGLPWGDWWASFSTAWKGVESTFWSEFQAMAGQVVRTLANAFLTAMEQVNTAIENGLITAGQIIITALAMAGQAAMQALTSAIMGAGGQLQAAGQFIASTITAAITSAFIGAGNLAQGIADGIRSGIAAFSAIGQQIASTLLASIVNGLRGVGNLAQGIADSIRSGIATFGEIGGQIAKTLLDGILGILSRIGGGGLTNGIVASIRSGIQQFTQIGQTIAGTLLNGITGVLSGATGLVDGIAKSVSSGITQFTKIGQDIANALLDGLTGIADGFRSVVIDPINQAIAGWDIQGKLMGVGQQIADAFGGAGKAVADFFANMGPQEAAAVEDVSGNIGFMTDEAGKLATTAPQAASGVAQLTSSVENVESPVRAALTRLREMKYELDTIGGAFQQLRDIGIAGLESLAGEGDHAMRKLSAAITKYGTDLVKNLDESNTKILAHNQFWAHTSNPIQAYAQALQQAILKNIDVTKSLDNAVYAQHLYTEGLIEGKTAVQTFLDENVRSKGVYDATRSGLEGVAKGMGLMADITIQSSEQLQQWIGVVQGAPAALGNLASSIAGLSDSAQGWIEPILNDSKTLQSMFNEFRFTDKIPQEIKRIMTNGEMAFLEGQAKMKAVAEGMGPLIGVAFSKAISEGDLGQLREFGPRAANMIREGWDGAMPAALQEMVNSLDALGTTANAKMLPAMQNVINTMNNAQDPTANLTQRMISLAQQTGAAVAPILQTKGGLEQLAQAGKTVTTTLSELPLVKVTDDAGNMVAQFANFNGQLVPIPGAANSAAGGISNFAASFNPLNTAIQAAATSLTQFQSYLKSNAPTFTVDIGPALQQLQSLKVQIGLVKQGNPPAILVDPRKAHQLLVLTQKAVNAIKQTKAPPVTVDTSKALSAIRTLLGRLNALPHIKRTITYTYRIVGTRPNPPNLNRTITYTYRTVGTRPAATGFHGEVSKPMMMMVGEQGRERVTVEPISTTNLPSGGGTRGGYGRGGGGAGGDGAMVIKGDVMLDAHRVGKFIGRAIAENNV